MLILWIAGFQLNGWSQSGDTGDDESYGRANLAFSGFSLLGISETAYTRAVKCQNYLEPERRSRKLLINGEEFLDDGVGNDRVANDGILTSTNVYTYKKGELPRPIGFYTPVNKLLLADESFRHHKGILPDFITIKCKFFWVSCLSWPVHLRDLCYRLAWPFDGFFEVRECEVIW